MDKLRVAIVEDEPLALERLSSLLADYTGAAVEIVAEAESIAEVVEGIDSWNIDLLLCDIRLADGLSFTIWDHATVPCPTVFTTAYEEYALRAFKVNSIDYLLKPIQAEELYATLTRFAESLQSNGQTQQAAMPAQQAVSPEVIAQVMQAVQQQQQTQSFRRRFMSKIGDRLQPIDVDDIAHFASIDRITWAYRFDGSRVPLGETMDQVERSLNPQQFARLNRACIAQAKAIEQLTAYSNSRFRAHITGSEVEPVIVSRERVSTLKSWLAGG